MREVILLDNESTLDLFCNEEYVEDIQIVKRGMNVESTGGDLHVIRKGVVPGYDRVWFERDGMTNILALKNVSKQYRATYDSRDEKFIVHRQEFGLPDMVFHMHESGLHIHIPDKKGKVFVETVAGNMKLFTKKDTRRAEAAKRLYDNLKFPSMADYK